MYESELFSVHVHFPSFIMWVASLKTCRSVTLCVTLCLAILLVPKVAACAEPPTSELCGEWAFPLHVLARLVGKTPDYVEQLSAPDSHGIVIITILKDGAIDWTRTEYGVTEGIWGLKNKGDRCCSVVTGDKFLVLDAATTPQSTKITLRRDGKQPGVITFEAKFLNSKCIELSTRENQEGKAGSDGRRVLMRRLPPEIGSPRVPSNLGKSKLSGCWGMKDRNGVEQVMVLIRDDGSFSWPGVAEGISLGWYELSNIGDESHDRQEPVRRFRVQSASYEPNRSRIVIASSEEDGAFITTPATTEIEALGNIGASELTVTITVSEAGSPEIDRTRHVERIRLTRVSDPCIVARSLLEFTRESISKGGQ